MDNKNCQYNNCQDDFPDEDLSNASTSTLLKKIKALEKQCNQYQKLLHQVDDYRKKINESRKEIRRERNRYERLNSELETKNQELINLLNKVDQFKDDIKQKNIELRRERRKMERLNIKLEQNNNELEKKNNELKELTEKLTLMARTDPLTKLNNRGYFHDQLKALFNISVQDNSEMACILFDIDKFKLLNDNYGHQQGDEVLIEISYVITTYSMANAVCARYGGEEFVILLPNTSFSLAIEQAEQLRKAINDFSFTNVFDPKNPLTVTVSLGVSARQELGIKTEEELVSLSDKALYWAKDHGRNQVCGYSEDIS